MTMDLEYYYVCMHVCFINVRDVPLLRAVFKYREHHAIQNKGDSATHRSK